MSKGNSWETDILAALLKATALANVLDNAATAPITSLYIALHTADPGEGGSQTTSEASYTSYARVAVVRSGSGWTVAGGAAENAAAINFPACTGGTNTITHFSVGRDASGAGYVFYKGALSASLAVSSGITPSFAAGTLDITED